jgi:HSP20 family protein
MAQEQQQGSAEESVPESGRQGKGVTRSEQTTPERYWSFPSGPFSLMRRVSDTMDRAFDDFFSRGLTGSSLGLLDWPSWPEADTRASWWPELEVFHQGNKLVIQADLPGLKKEDVKVEVKDNELCISGERAETRDQEERGYYRTERSYGSFCRTIPLPQGAKADTASATFDNGVLRIEVDAPSEATERRRIEVRGGTS